MTPLKFEPLTPDLMDALGQTLKGSWGGTCWCMYPRLKEKELKALPGDGPVRDRRRSAMQALAQRDVAPGVLAFQDDAPVGWAAVAPRQDYARVDGSRATPRVDETPVWVIPCVTVARTARGQGISVKLIEAAAAYAFDQGAPAVEAYPRAGDARTGADNAFFGTEPMFRRAGFDIVRPPIDGLPRNWTPRVAMRLSRPPDRED